MIDLIFSTNDGLVNNVNMGPEIGASDDWLVGCLSCSHLEDTQAI